MLSHSRSFVNRPRALSTQLPNELGQLDRLPWLQACSRFARQRFGDRLSPVGPLAGNRPGSTLRMAQDQRLHAADTARLEDFEGLPPQGVKRMPDLRPA